jgi:hypothetical protein
MTKLPRVAPYQSCIACFRGDTRTGFAAAGEAEFIVVAIHKTAGIPIDQAEGTFKVVAEHEMGCDPGMVPAGEVTALFRLCRDCADKTSTSVADLDDGSEVPCYRAG